MWQVTGVAALVFTHSNPTGAAGAWDVQADRQLNRAPMAVDAAVPSPSDVSFAAPAVPFV